MEIKENRRNDIDIDVICKKLKIDHEWYVNLPENNSYFFSLDLSEESETINYNNTLAQSWWI
ncbi:MAG TPA: hypothetical protein VNZ49_16460 [Bacteroidia bacterium]|jgi:hypothetical protein|nr:hypothetical protein [Bacteroidia bacterium]